VKNLGKLLQLVTTAAIAVAMVAGASHNDVAAPKPSIECQVRSL
jgi:hypothetical protein